MNNGLVAVQGEKTQAERIFAKFGGVPQLQAALVRAGKPRALSVIYRWNYPHKKGGSDGFIPTSAWPDIFAAARLEGIIITARDVYPGPDEG